MIDVAGKQGSVHRTVLLKEIILAFSNLNGEGDEKKILLDCTFGGGGHSLGVLREYPNVKVIAVDQDKSAFERSAGKFKEFENRITFINANFKNLGEIFNENLDSRVDGIIFDLGLSSDQLSSGAGESGRGFSFLKNEPLVMNMKEKPEVEDLTAFEIVNNWSEENLAKIIYGYGEERYSRRIARAIALARERKEIKTTFDLVKIIENAVSAAYIRGRAGGRASRLHFATRTFQALRIAVNDELQALQKGLEEGFKILKPRGRIAVISFHSLEDRIVKRFFKEKAKRDEAILISKKPVVAGSEEIKNNARSRSAKLRIIEKL